MGVVSAILTFVGFKLKLDGWAGTNSAEWLALGMYILLMIFFVRYSRRARIGD